jgi:hypothetical protein
MEINVTYSPRDKTYILDLNMNDQVDPEEANSPVPAESIPLCIDGNPFT